jgi:hypothetical protein
VREIDKDPTASNMVIAQRAGIDEKTVRRMRGSAFAEPNVIRIGRDGKPQRVGNRRRGQYPPVRPDRAVEKLAEDFEKLCFKFGQRLWLYYDQHPRMSDADVERLAQSIQRASDKLLHAVRFRPKEPANDNEPRSNSA